MASQNTPAPTDRTRRQQLIQAIGDTVVRFQESSNAFDEVAAEILAVDRTDLKCMTMLLFGGPASAAELAAALHLQSSTVATTVARLQLAGYARHQPGEGARIELTEHAGRWIERIWAPLRMGGVRLLDAHPTSQLVLFAAFLRSACDVQEAQTRKLRTWLGVRASPARRAHLRGGLSPAALRRVQLFVEANLARRIHLHDLAARAGLSPYHFSRAFKTSAEMTPRAFVESRRIERAQRALRESSESVADIALATGFGTQSRLTTTLKRRTGFTPAAYRRGRA